MFRNPLHPVLQDVGRSWKAGETGEAFVVYGQLDVRASVERCIYDACDQPDLVGRGADRRRRSPMTSWIEESVCVFPLL